MRRLISCDISFGEFELVCAKCGKTILTMFSPEYAPASMQHSPVTCNEDGSHTFAGQNHGELTFLTNPASKKESPADWSLPMTGLLSSLRRATKEVSDLKDDVKKAYSGDTAKG